MENLYFAIVCSSNMNRSMEAHAFLAKKGFNVKSFGTADRVKLPGASANRPNCYEFGRSYDDIYKDLLDKNKAYYTQTGLLRMLDRNRRIKPCPEKFQASKEQFDVIITCEERVYDDVVDWFVSQSSVSKKPVHVINIDIKDTHEGAYVGAMLIGNMVTKMAQSDDLDKDINGLLHQFEAQCKRQVLNCIMFY